MKLHRRGWQRLWLALAVVASLILPPWIVGDAWKSPRTNVLSDLSKYAKGKCHENDPSMVSSEKCPGLYYLSASLNQGGYRWTEQGYRLYIADKNWQSVLQVGLFWSMVLAVSYFLPWGLYTVGRWIVAGFRSSDSQRPPKPYKPYQHKESVHPDKRGHKQYWR